MILINIFLAKINLAVVMLAALATVGYAQNPVQVYFGNGKAAMSEIISLLTKCNSSVKVAVLAAAIFVALLFYLRQRDIRSNNVRKAREYHQKGVKLHEKGKEDAATVQYQKANEFREKADTQL